MRIAICVDAGAPSELLRDGLLIGQTLEAKGHNPIFITGEPLALVDNAGGWTPTELFQAPIPPSVPSLVFKRAAPDGFADQMAIAGFDDLERLITLATIWKRQLQMLKPDLILGFCSPVLWLVGPTCAPTFALGCGPLLPPTLGGSFPRQKPDSVPLCSEDLMLQNMNATLLKLGQAPVAALSDIFVRTTTVLYGVPFLDPYLQLRRVGSIGLLGERPSPAVPPVETRMAAFLDVNCPAVETIVLALANMKVPVDVYVCGATVGIRRYLEQQPTVHFWRDGTSFLQQLKSASGIAHHAVHDIAQRAFSIGRPQFLIPWTREQETLAGVMQWMGLSYSKSPNSAIDDMEDVLNQFIRDTSLSVAAQHHARQLSQIGLTDALPIIVEQIEAVR